MNNDGLKPYCGYLITVNMKAGDSISGVFGDITNDKLLLILPRNKLVHLPMLQVDTIFLRRNGRVLSRDTPPWRQTETEKSKEEMI